VPTRTVDVERHVAIQALRSEIDSVNEWVYYDINNGVYKCGFAQSQAAYDDAFKALFAGLDKLEDLLSKRRYVASDVMTEADVRAFATLVRFDEVITCVHVQIFQMRETESREIICGVHIFEQE